MKFAFLKHFAFSCLKLSTVTSSFDIQVFPLFFFICTHLKVNKNLNIQFRDRIGGVLKRRNYYNIRDVFLLPYLFFFNYDAEIDYHREMWQYFG